MKTFASTDLAAEIQAAAADIGEPVSARCAHAIAQRLTNVNNHDDAEIWRPISDFEGRYEVSSLGRVRSMSRFETGHAGEQRWRPGRILTQHRTQPPRLPYLRVALCHNGKMVTRSVARLLCAAFHGAPSSQDLQAAHLNNDPTDNRPENLAWATPAENLSHQDIFGTRPRGEAKKLAILNDDLVRQIRSLVAPDFRARRIANKLGLPTQVVHGVIFGRTWKHVS